MYIIPQETIDNFLRKKEVLAIPLPPAFYKHKKLIRSIEMADRLWRYSDCSSTCRSGDAVEKEFKEQLTHLFEQATDPDEKDLLQKLKTHYSDINFYSVFPELYHPDFHENGRRYTDIEQFIQKIGVDNLAVTLDQMNTLDVELQELFFEVIQYINSIPKFEAMKRKVPRLYVYLSPAIRPRELRNYTRFGWVQGSCLSIPEELHQKIDKFLTDRYNAHFLTLMAFYTRKVGNIYIPSETQHLRVEVFQPTVENGKTGLTEIEFSISGLGFRGLLPLSSPVTVKLNTLLKIFRVTAAKQRGMLL